MTTKSSPAVARVVAILNFFLEHSDQPFSLTQIAKSLRLSRATTHLNLLSLVQAGYLYRRNDKSYVLGSLLPALTASASASASEQISSFPVGRQEMRELADEFEVMASAIFVEGDEIVVRDRAASAAHLGGAERMTGVRYAMYPWGGVFLLPLSSDEILEKLATANPPLEPDVLEKVWKEISFGRKHGFVATLLAPDGEPARGYLDSGDFITDLGPDGLHTPWFLAAPVIGDRGIAEFAITLFGFRKSLSPGEILAIGERLRTTCDQIGQSSRSQ